MVTTAVKLKDACCRRESYNKPRQRIKKQTHHVADKGPYIHSNSFSHGRVQRWELNRRENWVPKNWCFWAVVLEKTLESPLDYKEIQPVYPKGNQSWIFTGRTDAEAETPVLWLPDAKGQLIREDPDAGKGWKHKEKGVAEDEMVRWHYWLNGREFEQTPGDSRGQRSLVSDIVHGVAESDTT